MGGTGAAAQEKRRTERCIQTGGRSRNVKKELELYVHIPFCVKKCAYCDFLSGPAGEAEKAAYTEALLREIKGRREAYRDYRVSTVFLGGGTPSVLTGEETARIFHALGENFDISRDAEITMEVNPGTVTGEKAAAWRQCGVNRLSIGLQSADDRELEMLGRIHTFREFLDTWEIVRKVGFCNVNVDLISAIPGQTEESWEHTLRTVAELGPEHLSAYSLIIEEGTPFYEKYGSRDNDGHTAGALPLPDEDTERQIYQMTGEVLKTYGYHRYEISNYAKQGYECRHNLGYWDRKQYLGLGLGAASLVEEQRFHNTVDMRRYMEIFGEGECGLAVQAGAGQPLNGETGTALQGPAAEETETLSVEDRMEEFMFLGLRKTEGISSRKFQENFGRPVEEVYGEQTVRFESLGLMERDGDRLRLTERGIDVSNAVFAEFIL